MLFLWAELGRGVNTRRPATTNRRPVVKIDHLLDSEASDPENHWDRGRAPFARNDQELRTGDTASANGTGNFGGFMPFGHNFAAIGRSSGTQLISDK
jgi:hypothetical protein